MIGSGGLSDSLVWRFKFMCNPCKTRYSEYVVFFFSIVMIIIIIIITFIYELCIILLIIHPNFGSNQWKRILSWHVDCQERGRRGKLARYRREGGGTTTNSTAQLYVVLWIIINLDNLYCSFNQGQCYFVERFDVNQRFYDN